MQIHIHKDGQQYGPYSPEDVTMHIRDGTLDPDDLAWYEGASEWIPLKTVPCFSLQHTQLTPPPPIVHLKPKLWNPNAAANWSLLFTPILGAWLHAHNWRELNQINRANKSMIWVYLGFVFLIIILFLPDNLGAGPGLIFLIAWYFSSAKGQVKYLKEKNITYDKKEWGKPLLFGMLGLVVYFAIIMTFLLITEPAIRDETSGDTQPSITEILEAESVSLVTQIVQEQLGGTTSCKTVAIVEEASDGFYHAVAYMNDGDNIKIIIEIKENQIFVTVPNQ